MPAGVFVEPRDLLVEGAGTQVEGDRRLGDLVVVDGADGLGVAGLGRPDRHAVLSTPRQGRRRRPGAAYPGRSAPLAQSAERFHGKEKVYGSIP